MHVDYKTESWQNTMKGRSADLFAFFCAFLCAAPKNENKYLCQQLHRSLAARGKKSRALSEPGRGSARIL